MALKFRVNLIIFCGMTDEGNYGYNYCSTYIVGLQPEKANMFHVN